MLSKKSFWGAKQFFLEALVRRYEKDVGGHIIIRISNRQPSLGLYAELEYRRPVSTCAQGKNSVCSFWTFSTASVKRDTFTMSAQCRLVPQHRTYHCAALSDATGH